MSENVRYLYILFDVRADRLVSNPFFWYFFAYLDPKLIGLADPTFLIPSTDFHQLAAPRLRNGIWYFTMAASMEPKKPRQMARYRVRTVDLGQRVLEILTDLQKSHVTPDLPSELFGMPGVVLLRRRR